MVKYKSNYPFKGEIEMKMEFTMMQMIISLKRSLFPKSNGVN